MICGVQGVVLTLISLQICEESFSCLRPDKRKEFLSDYQNLVLEASGFLWLFLPACLLTVFWQQTWWYSCMGFHLSNIVHQNAREQGILGSREIHLAISGFEDEMSVFLHFLQGFPELHRMARARNQHSFGLKARHNYYHNKIRALVRIFFPCIA